MGIPPFIPQAGGLPASSFGSRNQGPERLAHSNTVSTRRQELNQACLAHATLPCLFQKILEREDLDTLGSDT